MRRLIATILACVLAVVVVSFVLIYHYRDKVEKVFQMTETDSEAQSLTEALVPETEKAAPSTETELPLTPKTGSTPSSRDRSPGKARLPIPVSGANLNWIEDCSAYSAAVSVTWPTSTAP